MKRLCEETLATLPPDMARPAYDRRAVRRGVVHLGLGAFHRAHQAAVFEAALASGDMRWGVTAASLRSPDARDRLAPQDGLYTLVVRDGSGESAQVIGAVQEVLVAPENPERLLAALAAPDTHLVTLTVTEKGYHLDPATGALRFEDPAVAGDLANPERPATAIGFLVAALARRRTAGLPPFTAMSCDNLSHNGETLRAAVLAFAERVDPALARWIEAEGAFPSTMVDRIVPATTDADIARVAARIGVEDRATVATEPFWQWVVEDRFAGERPDLAAFGAQLTGEVAPWEMAKLRLLNGAHSAIAYLGGLAGFAFVHDVVAAPAFRRMVERLWHESAATLEPPAGLDIPAYTAALMARFGNPALGHRTHQIAADGSQKLPPRLLGPIAWRLERGLPADALALAVAGWIRWQAGVDDRGGRHAVNDPLAQRIAQALAGADTPAERVRAVLDLDMIVSPGLAAMSAFAELLTRALAVVETEGAAAAVEKLGG